MKKILLTLGGTIAIVAPIATTISCNSKTEENKEINFDQQLLDKLNGAVDFGAKNATYIDNLVVLGKNTTGKITTKFKTTKEVKLGGITFEANKDMTIIIEQNLDETNSKHTKVTINEHVLNETQDPIDKIVEILSKEIENKHNAQN